MDPIRLALDNQTTFALRLARAAVADSGSGGGNLALSPVSLHIVLSLLAVGANGPTFYQTAAVIGAAGGPNGLVNGLTALAEQVVDDVLVDGAAFGGPRLVIANGVWVDASLPLKDEFKCIAIFNYKADIRSVDFISQAAEVVKQVNSWAENFTDGFIKELLPPNSVDHNTRLVFGNAVHFKGEWAKKFDSAETKEGEFFLLDGSSVHVPYMTSSSKQFLSAYDGFSVLRLLYKHGEDQRQFSMLFFLPEARDGLQNLADKLSAGFEFLNRHIPEQAVATSKFLLPKFRISFGFDASSVLKKGFGLELPFGDGCDLTDMAELPFRNALSVSSIFHKCYIEVNEEGTEAATASAVVIGLGSAPATHDFVADHPFIFIVREEITGVVLFVGYVLNPLEDA